MRIPIFPRAVVPIVIIAVAACSVESPSAPLDEAPQFSHSGSAPHFGAKASGSELWTPGIVTDGGPGASSAEIGESDFTASASFASGATYLPELRAWARNTTADNSDDITWARAEAYQIFTSTVAQTITLQIRLSGIVVDNATDVSYLLSNVWVYGGSTFDADESPLCDDLSLGRSVFDGVYFCGTRYGRSNLFIPEGDLTVPDALTFDVAAGETFGVFANLAAAASGGLADGSSTLTLEFDDDTNIEVEETPDGPEPPSAIEVDVDMKPDDEPDCLNPRSRGVIPVAIFGADAFDVAAVDLASLTFAGLEVGTRGKRAAPMCAVEDVNGDGIDDLLCHFRMDAGSLEVTDNTAALAGILLDGTEIEGEDEVCLVPRHR